MPTKKCRNSRVLKKSPFTATIVIIDSGERHQWILKLLVESLMGTEYLYSLEVNPHRTTINFEGKDTDFTLEKLGRHHVAQVTTNSGTNWLHGPPEGNTKNTSERHSSCLMTRKHERNPNWRAGDSSDTLRAWKIKKGRGSCVSFLPWLRFMAPFNCIRLKTWAADEKTWKALGKEKRLLSRQLLPKWVTLSNECVEGEMADIYGSQPLIWPLNAVDTHIVWKTTSPR